MCSKNNTNTARNLLKLIKTGDLETTSTGLMKSADKANSRNTKPPMIVTESNDKMLYRSFKYVNSPIRKFYM